MNNRVGITYGTNSVAYVVNPNAALSQVLMRVKNGVTNYYIYGVGLLYEVTETATATNTLTYHYDYRGSTIALSDGNGNVTDRMEYSAYATLTYRTGTHDTPFLFNGRYGVMTDPNGLLYMRARYYNPYLCRFLNADPSGFSGGLNFYAYADGNPVSYLDPFGLGTLGENNISPSSYNLGGENLVSTSTPPYPYGPIISETQVLGHYGVYSIPGPTSLGLGAIGPTGQPFWDTQVTFSQSFNGSGLQTYNSQVTTTGTIWPGGACNTIAGTSFGAGSMLFNMSAAPGNYLVNVYASFNLNGTGGGGAEAILYLGTNRQPILYGSTDYPLSLQTNFSIPVTVPASGSTTSPFFIYSPSIGINQGPTASGAANGTFNFLVIPH